MPIAQFAPFSSVVQPSFWHELTKLKIDVLQLSDASLPIVASYSTGRTVKDRESGREIPLGCNVTVGSESFDKDYRLQTGSVPAGGVVKNFNTIEDFKAADKTALFNQEAQNIWNHITQNRDTSLLTRFLLITFADLKKYKYYYWFAFPAFASKPAWDLDEQGWSTALSTFSDEALESIHSQLKSQSKTLPFFLVRTEAHGVTISPVESYESFFASVPSSSRTIAFLDPSADSNPGWPLRNLLAYLRALYPDTTSSLRVLCWRDSELPVYNADASTRQWKSRFGVLEVKAGEEQQEQVKPAAVGWEKNPQGKLGPRVADLGPMMDPKLLAEQAVDLNLKLMRWRILPSLDLEKMSQTRCLLLGAGTLGCYVARTLMGWGVRTITLVDSARVSFSNPVRQPLFEFEDCLNGGKPKAECAAEKLKKIFPGVNANGHTLSIPMPGHPIPPLEASVAQAAADVEKLEKLIYEHDAIFLLMDSRESRWLPTVIGAAKHKIVLNAALGFDTFLVMRHGVRAGPNATEDEKNNRLGCYYCNDIVAPSDSLTDRTLDQMCTVTRPGLAAIAASTAVELLASIVQHPDGVRAQATPPNQDLGNHSYTDEGGSVLGQVPHQIRGFLAQFRNLQLVGAAYNNRCTGCGEPVLQAYEKEGFSMLLKAFNDQKYLETLTGLDQLFAEGEAALETVDWDEEEDDF